jgi:hypothetical protein
MFDEKPIRFEQKPFSSTKSEANKKDNKRHTVEETPSGGKTKNLIRCCSSILVGVEFLTLLGIVKELSQGKIGIPVSYEHDRCLCLVDERNGPFNLENTQRIFHEIMVESTKFSLMELELKELEFEKKKKKEKVIKTEKLT